MTESSRGQVFHALKSDLTIVSGYTQLIARECRREIPDLDRIGVYTDLIQRMVVRLGSTIDGYASPR